MSKTKDLLLTSQTSVIESSLNQPQLESNKASWLMKSETPTPGFFFSCFSVRSKLLITWTSPVVRAIPRLILARNEEFLSAYSSTKKKLRQFAPSSLMSVGLALKYLKRSRSMEENYGTKHFFIRNFWIVTSTSRCC